MTIKKTTYTPPKGQTSTIGIRGHKQDHSPHIVKVAPHQRHTKHGIVMVGGYTKVIS